MMLNFKKKNQSKIKLSGILFFVSIANFSFAQPVLDWAGQIGNIDSQNATSISIDSEGNSYILGSFYSELDFDITASVQNVNPVAIYYSEIFVAKYDVNGLLVWVKHFGGESWHQAVGIKVDHNNDVYLTGRFQQTIDFDPSATGVYNMSAINGYDGVFISKLDSDGNFLWAKSGLIIYMNNQIFAGGLDVDADNNVFITGGFNGTIDFGAGHTLATPADLDLFVLKLNAAGDFVWAKSTGNTILTYTIGYSVNVDLNNSVLITGYFRGSIDFDAGAGTGVLTSTNSVSDPDSDWYILKLDNDGNFTWVKQIGSSTGQAYGIDITSDKLGNIIVAGGVRMTSGLMDMDPGAAISTLDATGWYNSVIVKLDMNGNFIWAKNIAQDMSQTEAVNVTTDGCGNIFTSGRFMGGTGDFDPGSGVFSMTPIWQDIFVSELDKDGNFVWADQFGVGSIYTNKNNDIVADDFGNIYLTGGMGNGSDPEDSTSVHNFSSTDANYQFVNKGYSDIFLAKFSRVSTLSVSVIDSVLCLGDSTNISATGGSNYAWTPSTGLNTNSGSIVIAQPITTTTYTISSGVGFCIESKLITIVVKPLPVLVLSTIEDTLCAGGSTDISINGAVSYLWMPTTDFLSTTASEISVIPLANTTYTVIGTSNGCSDSISQLIVVNQLPLINISPETTIIQGTSTTLNATGGGTYLWTPASTLSCSTCFNPTANPSTTTNYCVTVSKDGCVSVKCVDIKVDILCGELYVPNVFSPNGDGVNDVLQVKMNPSCISSFSFLIFDRWGEKIFESTNINDVWDGKFKGEILNSATFVYDLTITLKNDSEPISQKGNISIVN